MPSLPADAGMYILYLVVTYIPLALVIGNSLLEIWLMESFLFNKVLDVGFHLFDLQWW
jgi:hypothetical protein